MKTLKLALDTSAINYLADNVCAFKFKDFLNLKCIKPYVCSYVFYELSRTLNTNVKIKAMHYFNFLEQLRPNYIASLDILLNKEYSKLKSDDDIDINIEVSEAVFALARNRASLYKEGVKDPSINEEVYENERQEVLQIARRSQWIAKDRTRKTNIEKTYSNSFDLYFSTYWEKVLDKSFQHMKFFGDVIKLASENNICLTNDDINKISANIASFPAMYICVRNHAYLNFLTDIQVINNAPKEDRFTDGNIILETAYCDILLSQDHALISKHAKNINPKIVLMSSEEFIKNN